MRETRTLSLSSTFLAENTFSEYKILYNKKLTEYSKYSLFLSWVDKVMCSSQLLTKFIKTTFRLGRSLLGGHTEKISNIFDKSWEPAMSVTV